MCVELPLVAVTVMLYVPAGVPPLLAGGVLLFPPPQPTPAAKNVSSMSPSPATRRRTGTPRTKMLAKRAPLLAASQPKRPDAGVNAPDMLRAAVVLTVSVEVPEAFATELKLNPQVGAGVPPPVMLLQVSATAPVKPPVGAMVTVDVAEAPAATVAGDRTGAVMAKSGAATVRLTEVL